MMRRLWLAAVLGVILGLGMTVIPNSIVSREETNLPPATLAAQHTAGASTPPWGQYQFILLGLIAGIVVALPASFLAKRRD